MNKVTTGPVPLVTLVREGHADTVGQLVDRLLDRGFAVGAADGLLVVDGAVAERLRADRAEAERREAERQMAVRQEQERRAAEQAAAAEAQTRRLRRISRIERVTGMSVMLLQQAMEREDANRPGVGGTLAQQVAQRDRVYTLDDVEAYVRDAFGDHVLDGVAS